MYGPAVKPDFAARGTVGCRVFLANFLLLYPFRLNEVFFFSMTAAPGH
jgi:hypothetical protein